MKLYEKIRFLQSYPNKGSANRDDESTVNKYSSQYEARLDPFAAFNKSVSMSKTLTACYVYCKVYEFTTTRYNFHLFVIMCISQKRFPIFQEKQQRYLGLSAHDKVTLNMVS